MTTKLTQEIAYKWLQEFFQRTPFVLFGSGLSCAIDGRFGMWALQEHLLDALPEAKLTTEQLAEWNQVAKDLEQGTDLETAMNHVQDSELVNIVCVLTGDFVSTLCHEYAVRIFNREVVWPPIRLFEKLVEGLSETDRTLHVSTTNYDLLAEYSFDLIGLPYITGFTGGICRKLDWARCSHAMTTNECVRRGKSVSSALRFLKHIRFYKVHGSLNTFLVNDEVVENDYWTAGTPPGVERAIIVPGMAKYEKLHELRGSFLHEFDEAQKKHDAFLFMGFGFNDAQLANKTLMSKLKQQKCPALVLTRGITSNIESLARECDNLWVVCKQEGEGNDNARIFNRRYEGWLNVGVPLWDVQTFTQTILGG